MGWQGAREGSRSHSIGSLGDKVFYFFYYRDTVKVLEKIWKIQKILKSLKSHPWHQHSETLVLVADFLHKGTGVL